LHEIVEDCANPESLLASNERLRRKNDVI